MSLSPDPHAFPGTSLAASDDAAPGGQERTAADRLAFWAWQAGRLDWATGWDEVLDWSDAPFARWFTGGRLNVAYNCVDRHVEAGHGDQVAFHWEGEPGDLRTITYADLKREVCKTANALLSLGLTTGDRVAIQLPMIPEAVFAMLACARLGLPHSVVFGGFSPGSLQSRIEDAEARLLITSDGQYRRGRAEPMKANADIAVRDTSSIEHVLVVARTGSDVSWTEGRDLWWHDVVDAQPDEHASEAFDSEHPLFILYTSGTTDKPKGILHTSGGYLVQAAYTHRTVFDLAPEKDVYWCTADIGWITGHSYLVYGPLANRATSVMYEGTPNTPHEGRHFEIIEKYGVTVYYTAPTLIRTFMKWGEHIPARYDLGSIRVLGSVGEPINPEAWRWYREHVGGDRVPIADTWWQTETGAIMIAPLPGGAAAKPGSARTPLPGISAKVVDDRGREVGRGYSGYLVLDQPWPSMLRGVWGDEQRYRETYWSRFARQGYYFAGDGARYDEDGDIWLLGRVDDVMNVSGHRISTAEVESALVSHPAVAESAVVGASDATTGQAIVAFVILRAGATAGGTAREDTVTRLREHVAREIGPIAKPRQIIVIPELPKTRSGKIMRRLLRDVVENREVGDVTSLADSSVMDSINAGLGNGSFQAGADGTPSA
ncbi:acetate--CoA ligase [Actinomadura madurae]|uniref:Acetate--CoA ligase n=1 Tax=Actinomadura madurae TaxID=1993 RepID=A0A1I5KPX6_9ACTN|nr:acetate--CoA ligase [Actinomadura madurae]SFO86903.1 acetyl-coenzyme A synthetase [Actinomadura madurae]SPT49909.1 Acetyl-coenzyme A synthetase [Actinomadura madurae]